VGSIPTSALKYKIMNEKELQLKIAKKYGLPISPDKWDNYTKKCMRKAYLKEFDLFLNKLITKNGVTELWE